MNTVVTKRAIALKDFKVEIKAQKLDIVKSDRTGKLYAKNGNDIVATVSKDLDIKGEIEVLHMQDTDSNEEWFFVKNITSYTAVGAL